MNTRSDREMVRELVVEFLGPFALMFMGGGAILVTEGSDLVAIALAHGLAIGLLVAAAGHISGGVYNPALTIGLMATRRMPLEKGITYIISQCLGGIAAALCLLMIFPGRVVDAVALGVPAVGPGYEVGGALVAEFVGTFFLMFVVFGTAIDPRGARPVAPLAIGLTITIGVFAVGGVSGAAFNPSRWIGPAIVHGEWADAWLYWVGPIAGAVAAALLYNNVLMDSGRPTQVASQEPPSPVEPGHRNASQPRRRRR